MSSSKNSNKNSNDLNANQQRNFYTLVSQKFNQVIKFLIYFIVISFILVFSFFSIVRFIVLPKFTENSENITDLINKHQNLVSVKIQTIKPIWNSDSFLLPGIAFENIHLYSKQQNSQEILRIKSAEAILAFENIWHFNDIYHGKKIPKFTNINIIKPEFYVQFISNETQEDILNVANIFNINLTEIINNKNETKINFIQYLFQQKNISIQQAKVYIFNKNLNQKLANNFISFSWEHSQPYLELHNKKINEHINIAELNFELFNDLNLLKHNLNIKKIFGHIKNLSVNFTIAKNDALENVLEDYKVQSHFHNLGFQYVNNNSNAKNNAEVKQEDSTNATTENLIKILGINHISGNLNVNADTKTLNPNIKISLDSKNIQLYLPDIFDTTIVNNNTTNTTNITTNNITNILTLHYLKGNITIKDLLINIANDENSQQNNSQTNQQNSTRSQIIFSDFNFANNDVKNGKFNGVIKLDGNVNLLATADSADGKQVYKYLPLVINKDVRNWVKNAVISADGINVKFKMKGNIHNFPFKNIGDSETENDEIFYISADVKNCILNYAENWLPVQNIDASLEFFGVGMRILSDSANILKTQISNISVEIPDFLTNNEQLIIKGIANGETNEFLTFLQYGDLAKKIDNLVEKIKLKAVNKNATASLNLNLIIPLRSIEQVKIFGEVNVKNNDLQLLPEFLPTIKNVEGNLIITENGVSADNISSEVFNGNVKTKIDANKEKISIYNEGKVDFYQSLEYNFLRPYKIQNYLNIANPNLFKGNISFKDEINVFPNINNGNNISYNLTTDLKEVEILLPENTFLHKKIGEEAKFHLTINNNFNNLLTASWQNNNTNIFKLVSAFTPNKKHLNLNIDFLNQSNNYPELVNVENDDFHKVVINFSNEFILQNWLDIYHKFEPKETAKNTTNAEKKSPILVEFKSPNTNIFNRNIHNLDLKTTIDLSSNNDKHNYNIDIKSDEVSGKVAYIAPNEQYINGIINADFSQLKYSHKKNSNENSSKISNEQKNSFPDIVIKAEDVWLENISLGYLQFEAKNQNDSNSWKIEKLLIKNPDAELNGRGFWHPPINPLRDGHDEISRLDFVLSSSDVGKLLERFGYAESFEKGEAKLEGIIQWQGRPTTIDYPTLSGKLSLDVKNGQFSKFEPGVGRLLGLISLQSVLQRLTLNFSDVFSQGLAFSEISGEFDIKNGILKTLADKNLKITAPAATVQIVGQTDLDKETQNIIATIYPEVGFFTSLGLAMINPIAGAASALASSMGKNPIDKLFNYKYHIAGTWNNPIVDGEEKTEIVNSKNKNSNENSNKNSDKNSNAKSNQ